MAHPFFGARTPLSIGHRGCAGEAPENTLASFARGLADGADILESDVHLTRDDVPVLIHDDTVERCTDGRGEVRDLRLAELQELDAGYRFREDSGAPERGKGHRVPALSEALSAFPVARFNLELKEDLPGLVERCLDVIEEAGRARDVLLTAEQDPLMARLREAVRMRGTGVALGACLGEVFAFVRAAAGSSEPPPGPMALQIPARFGDRPLVTRALLEHAHARGVQVHVWTINEMAEIEALLELGVDGLVSDFPARVVAARERRA
jgi:glycerophosphoryl diester phosphodiesterase